MDIEGFVRARIDDYDYDELAEDRKSTRLNSSHAR